MRSLGSHYLGGGDVRYIWVPLTKINVHLKNLNITTLFICSVWTCWIPNDASCCWSMVSIDSFGLYSIRNTCSCVPSTEIILTIFEKVRFWLMLLITSSILSCIEVLKSTTTLSVFLWRYECVNACSDFKIWEHSWVSPRQFFSYMLVCHFYFCGFLIPLLFSLSSMLVCRTLIIIFFQRVNSNQY